VDCEICDAAVLWRNPTLVKLARLSAACCASYAENYVTRNFDLHSSSNRATISVIKSRRMGLAGDVVRMGEMRSIYIILVIKPEGKRP
jgi:hypothetical protein